MRTGTRSAPGRGPHPRGSPVGVGRAGPHHLQRQGEAVPGVVPDEQDVAFRVAGGRRRSRTGDSWVPRSQRFKRPVHTGMIHRVVFRRASKRYGLGLSQLGCFRGNPGEFGPPACYDITTSPARA